MLRCLWPRSPRADRDGRAREAEGLRDLRRRGADGPGGKPPTLELRFHVVHGYHVNSHTPKSELLIPTTLTLQPAAGVKAGDAAVSAGKPYSFSFDPADKLDVYAGDFTVKLPVVGDAGRSIPWMASLRYQACDNASCYPPRTVPVKVVFTAK